MIPTKEFLKEKRVAAVIPLSPFAHFHMALDGLIIFENAQEVPRWEVWTNGCKDPEFIIKGLTKYTAFKTDDYKGIMHQRNLFK